MFAGYQSARRARRGIILVVVLGMLGLMALIGVTFATYSAQARISARNFSLAHDEPEETEVMDFALSQLVDDTYNPISAIRGHSLKRDMYGNDANSNGYLTMSPSAGTPLVITAAAAGTGAYSGLIGCTTNMTTSDPGFYGYDFTRWVVRLNSGLTGSSSPYGYYVSESLEVIADDYSSGTHVLYVTPHDATVAIAGYTSTTTPTTSTSSLAGALLGSTNVQFVLDGRYLRAFNGPGLSAPVYPYGASGAAVPASTYGNFRLNGSLLGSPFSPMGDPDAVGMDEDYDACDLDNWFLAIQSADGQVVIPSFHRPAIIRADPTSKFNPPTASSWSNSSVTDWTGTTADSAARILRPRQIDGHSGVSFPDLLPNSKGQITYDVDNDGDGQTDSVWLDLGYPARRDPTGRLFKPLYAFMIIGLNGRLPLNTAGNLQDVNLNVSGTYPNITVTQGGSSNHSSSRLGYSPSEVDPTYALQNASVPATSADTNPPPLGASCWQVDNAGAYVNVTQLRNILTGTRPQTAASLAAGTNGDLNAVLSNGTTIYMPNGLMDGNDTAAGTDANGNTAVIRNVTPVAGRWGEIAGVPFYVSSAAFSTSVAAGLSLNYSPGSSVGIEDDNFTAFDPTGRSFDFIDYSGSLSIPTERVRRFGAPIDLTGNGLLTSYSLPTAAGSAGYGPDAFGRVMFQQYFRPSGKPTKVGNVAPGPGADQTTNPLHGFDAERNPLLVTPAGTTITTGIKGDATLISAQGTGGGKGPRYGQNEADEMRLYTPNEYDQAFDIGDLQWLYRQQDVDGATLTSRLSSLAPVSFTNSKDGQRRRRMFALDAWETNNFAWAPDNAYIWGSPTSVFKPATSAFPSPLAAGSLPDNSRFAIVSSQFDTSATGQVYLPLIANASFANLNLTQATVAGGALPFGEFNPVYNLTNAALPVGYSKYSAYGPANTNLVAAHDPSPPSPAHTPALAQRDRKINLNYPLPISNDPNEPIRQKWIRETYYLLKSILPPQSVDTPAEVARLSQFVINIIDFRDPDSTMTHWVNPDVQIVLPTGGTSPAGPQLQWAANPLPSGAIICDQYGMEYLPVAINEVLAYSFLRKDLSPTATTTAVPIPTNRFFVELVNTLTQSGTGPNSGAAVPVGTSFSFDPTDAYSSGSPTTPTGLDLTHWDMVIAEDDQFGRPDPTTGQLLTAGNLGTTSALNELYGPIPLNTGAGINGVPTAGTTPTSFLDFTQLTGAGGNPPLPKSTISGGLRQPIQVPGLMAQVNNMVTTPMGSGQQTLPTTGILNPNYQAQPQGVLTASASLAANQYINFSGATTPNSAGPVPWGPSAAVQNNPALNYFFVVGNLLPVIPQKNSGMGTEFVSNGATACELQPPLITNPIPDQIMTLMDGDSATSRPGTLPEYDLFDSVWNTDVSGLGVTVSGYLCNSNQKPSTDNSTAKNNTLVNATNATPGSNIHASGIAIYPLPQLVSAAATGAKTGMTKYYWLYLRRPANPFAATTDTTGTLPPAAGSGNNPMVVVDCMRFAYIEGTGAVTQIDQNAYANDKASSTGANQIYSIQRLQPFRGGHAISTLLASGTNPYGASGTIPAYGLSEQTRPASTATGNPSVNFGYFGKQTNQVTTNINETLGQVNVPNEPWDYFAFNDRDFMSVAELTLVPGCPPGLFTKQFVENAPLNFTASGGALATTSPSPSVQAATQTASSNYVGTTLITNQGFDATGATTNSAALPLVPHVYPYLIDNFFYSATSPSIVNPNQGTAATDGPIWPLTGGPSGAGWYKMFEFFEVPSPAFGAVDSVANGMNYDWARQDTKPGLLNLNLVVDEEVWLGLMGNLGMPNDSRNLGPSAANPSQSAIPMMNSNQMLNPNQAGSLVTAPTIENGAANQFQVPKVVTLTDLTGSPYQYAANQLMAVPVSNVGFFNADPNTSTSTVTSYDSRVKGAFSDFLKLRHGGSGYMFAWGTGAVGSIPTASGAGSPAAERPFHSLSYPDINFTVMRPAALPPPTQAALASPTWTTAINWDPGVKDPYALYPYTAGTVGGDTYPVAITGTYAPADLPPCRLFQIPDGYGSPAIAATPTAAPYYSNASVTGNGRIAYYTDPALSSAFVYAATANSSISTAFPNTAVYDLTAGSTFNTSGMTPTVASSVYLGNSALGAGAPPYDNRQHPYYRTEWLQKVMNLTTVRTHQFAVWITVAFFEVTKQGDPALANDSTNYAGAIDILGDEMNASSGRNKRLRSFFLLDRTKAAGFNPGTPGDFRTVVVYRQVIQE